MEAVRRTERRHPGVVLLGSGRWRRSVRITRPSSSRQQPRQQPATVVHATSPSVELDRHAKAGQLEGTRRGVGRRPAGPAGAETPVPAESRLLTRAITKARRAINQ
jgi:hypothetical protein